MARARFIVSAAALLLLCAGQARAQAEMYGLGRSSCAIWLSESGRYEEGIAWLLGYWSAVNVVSPKDHFVGHTTDGAGIIGEVRLECQKPPSEKFSDAIADVYFRLQETHR